MSDLTYSPDASDWRAPTLDSPLAATLRIPGSKSLTNRELILSALAESPSTLHAPLWSRDSELMIDALQALGATFERIPGASPHCDDLRIIPAAELRGGSTINCGLAGTVMRFAPPVAALANGATTFDGDVHARTRPMRPVLDGLRSVGAEIDDAGRGTLPFTVTGNGQLPGGKVTIDASKSSQFVSGLLLSAARFESGITLQHVGDRLPSIPHIDMTIDTLISRGVEVTEPARGIWTVAPGPISGASIDIEPDLSNAAPFLIAAIICGGSVTIDGWPSKTTQVGAQLADILPRFGATVTLDGNALTVHAPERSANSRGIQGVDLNLAHAGELVPNLAVLAALAETPSTLDGIGHIRGHETDRLAALSSELNRLGARVTELDDGLHIEPAPLHGGLWRAYADHRMATSGALIGLAVSDVFIDDIACTAKTLPQFDEMWLDMLASARP